MDGEIGRFSFTTYRVVATPSAGGPSFSPELFPNQRGKEWYRTRGFKQIAFIHGSSEKSYRKLSMALKGRQVGNRVLQELMPLLWNGLLDSAIE